jgi:hypothetical protein
MPAPTPDDILRETCIGVLWAAGETLHNWATEGGTITVPASELRPALEAAYDPNMPDWTALITHDSEEGFHVA